MKRTMVKQILFAALCLFVTTLGRSQEARFGFTASPTFSFPNIESSNNDVVDAISYDEDSNNTKTGISYGVLVDYDFDGNDRYFIHSGLIMNHTGFKYGTNGGFAPAQDYEVNVNYIEIPAVLKLKTNEMGYMRYYGQFGLNNAIKIGEKVKEGPEGEFSEFNTFNAGLNVGGGLEYAFDASTSAVVGLYYTNGFTKVIDNTAGNIKQNQLGIRLGVYF